MSQGTVRPLDRNGVGAARCAAGCLDGQSGRRVAGRTGRGGVECASRTGGTTAADAEGDSLIVSVQGSYRHRVSSTLALDHCLREGRRRQGEVRRRWTAAPVELERPNSSIPWATD